MYRSHYLNYTSVNFTDNYYARENISWVVAIIFWPKTSVPGQIIGCVTNAGILFFFVLLWVTEKSDYYYSFCLGKLSVGIWVAHSFSIMIQRVKYKSLWGWPCPHSGQIMVTISSLHDLWKLLLESFNQSFLCVCVISKRR